MSDRTAKIDQIRKHSDKLNELARQYTRLRLMADRPECTETFLELTEATGELIVSEIQQIGTILEILLRESKPVDG
jgi:hypothetical protein